MYIYKAYCYLTTMDYYFSKEPSEDILAETAKKMMGHDHPDIEFDDWEITKIFVQQI